MSQPLPDDYVTKGQQLAEKQIVIGGYRLAHLLTTIYGSQADVKKFII